MKNFKVVVNIAGETFVSEVYDIHGRNFLLYHPERGFSWYSTAMENDGKPAIMLFEEVQRKYFGY